MFWVGDLASEVLAYPVASSWILCSLGTLAYRRDRHSPDSEPM